MTDFIDRTEVLKVLQGFNPWWYGQEQAVPVFRRMAFNICKVILKNTQLKRAILLSGPRRVGKTTILHQIAQDLVQEGTDPKSVLYLSFDHPILKLEPVDEILRIYHETIYPEKEPAYLLLDELQYARDWDLHLKQLVDKYQNYRILVTGSAAVIHRQRISESGVGRWTTVSIPVLSFYEFLQIRQIAPQTIADDLRPGDLFNCDENVLSSLGIQSRILMPEFSRYLMVGGFPESALLSNITLIQRLLREDVVDRVLKRDMTSLFGLRNVNDLERLFLYICLHSGGILAVQACAVSLEVSPSTILNYLDLLEQANLIYRLLPVRLGGKKVLKAQHKVYLVDAALRNAVLIKGEEILSDPEEMGTIVETAVLRHLYAYYYRDNPQIQYWRDAKTGKEVDIIIKSPKYTIPVEVKYRSKALLTRDDGIVRFCEEENVDQAYWITQQERDIGIVRFQGSDTQFLCIPAHLFCYLLGQAEKLLWE